MTRMTMLVAGAVAIVSAACIGDGPTSLQSSTWHEYHTKDIQTILSFYLPGRRDSRFFEGDTVTVIARVEDIDGYDVTGGQIAWNAKGITVTGDRTVLVKLARGSNVISGTFAGNGYLPSAATALFNADVATSK